jgi:hypothetical protein
MAFLRFPRGSTATRRGVAAGVSCVALLALLFAGAPADAARKPPITGKLSKSGYTVFALAKNGKASSARTRPRKFKLRPPAKVVTLHLRAKDGTYAGPIVVGKKKKGKRAILGVKAGAKLGKVKVKAGKGYAKTKRKPPKKFVDAKRKARAKKGVPIGAGKFGRVRSKKTRGGAPGDLDLDGIPEPLDIDDDGDLILDNLDLSTAGGGARAAQTQGGCGFYCPTVSSYLPLASFEQTVNVNAGSDFGQINEALRSIGYLRFAPLSDTAELDCGGEEVPPDGWNGGLSYCTRGGTGIASAGGPGPPFPGPKFGQFDSDGDGFGTFPKPSFLAHRATTAQIKAGDPLTQRDDATGTEIFPTLNFVFVTVPALVSYSDTAGNSATVSYPVAPGGLGTPGNGFPVSAPAGEDVVVTFTFWRPQRQPIPGSDPDAAQWMDIGHLTYAASTPPGGGCPQGTFSTADPNLGDPPSRPLLGTGGLEDLKNDEVSNRGNILTYTLNLSQCLAANGLSSSFDEPGEEQMINFMAVSGATDTAQQTVSFERQ